MFKGKFLALDAYIRKEIPKSNNLNFHLGKSEKEEQISPGLVAQLVGASYHVPGGLQA